MPATLDFPVSFQDLPPPGDSRADAPAACHLPADLTHGEERVLPFLCAGWSDSEIALELELPEGCVRADILGCLQKFGANSRGLLAARLLRGEFGP